VILNACHAGHARTFGGHREDLVSTLLAEGAGAVVASAFPVEELVSEVVGTQLYSGPEQEAVGSAVVRVRGLLATSKDPVARGAWMLLTCHGDALSSLS